MVGHLKVHCGLSIFFFGDVPNGKEIRQLFKMLRDTKTDFFFKNLVLSEVGQRPVNIDPLPEHHYRLIFVF